MSNDEPETNEAEKRITKSLLEDLPSTAVQSIHLSTEDGRSVVENVDEEVFVWKDFKHKYPPLKLQMAKEKQPNDIISLSLPMIQGKLEKTQSLSSSVKIEKEITDKASKQEIKQVSPLLSIGKKSTIIDERRQSSIDSIKKVFSNIKRRPSKRSNINKADESNEKDGKLVPKNHRVRSQIINDSSTRLIRSKSKSKNKKSKTKGVQRNRSTQTINSLKKHFHRKKGKEKRRISKTKMVNNLEKKV